MAHLAVDHRFSAPLDAVQDALVDAAFYEQLELPDVGPVEVVSRDADGDSVRLALRMVFTGTLDRVGRRVVGDRELAWIQEVVFDTATYAGTLGIAAESQAERLSLDATMHLLADGDETIRHIEGDFVVKVPLVGGVAERKLLPGLSRRLDIEAESLRSWLARDR